MRRLILVAAALAFAVPAAAQGAANPPNPAASCTGLISNFASQFGSAYGHISAEAAKELRPLGQVVKQSAAQHLGSYEACIGG